MDGCVAEKSGNRHPQPGDVVITCPVGSGHSFGVSTTPEPPQLTFTSFELASSRALRFARHARVDVWVMDAGNVRRVGRHRVGARARAFAST